MADDTQAISDNAEFIGITEMPVNVKLLNVGICSGIGGHVIVGGFVRIIIIIKVHCFCVGRELFNNVVGISRVVFRNPCFYTGGIKDDHIGFSRVNGMADGFSKVNKLVEDRLDIIKEGLLEPCDLRNVRDLAEAAEFAEME